MGKARGPSRWLVNGDEVLGVGPKGAVEAWIETQDVVTHGGADFVFTVWPLRPGDGPIKVTVREEISRRYDIEEGQ